MTQFGIFKSKKLPQGIKQGPAIYQHMQDSAFKGEYKPNGDPLCHVFFDYTHVGDNEIQEHIKSLTQLLKIARVYNIPYRLAKYEFC